MSLFKRNATIIFILTLCLIIFSQYSLAATLPLRLAWNRNTESDLAYYGLYYGTSSRNYTNFIMVDKRYTTYTLDQNNLSVGRTYYIALTAIDLSLNESAYSQELTVRIDSAATTTTIRSSGTTTTIRSSGTTTTTTPDSSNVIEAEDMSYHACGAQTGDYWNLWSNGSMTQTVYFPTSGIHRFEIIAKAQLANNIGAEMKLLIDGETRGRAFVNSTIPETYAFDVEISEGTHEIAIRFCNDYYEPQEFAAIDRNLLVDKTIIDFAATDIATTTTTTTIIRPVTTSVPVDATPPTGSITINDGAASTNSRKVTLTISAEDLMSGMGAGAQMMLSNDNKKWFGPKPFVQTTSWVLSAGEGVKTVYAKCSDAKGNWMEEPSSDSIELSFSCAETVQLEPASTDCSGTYLKLWSDQKAVDGKIATGWLSPLRRMMREEYLNLDLGDVKIINRIEIHSNRFIGRDLFPSDFKVQVSTDFQNWTDIITVEDYTLPASRSDSWSFDCTEASFIQLLVTKPQKFMFLYYATYISEIEVYGCTEPEVPEPESLAATQSAGQADVLLSQEAFDREVAGRKGAVLEGTAPGRPGKPFFILEGK